jgi:hypothetical protein
MDYAKVRRATRLIVKTLFKIGASLLRAYVFKLVAGVIIPTALIEPFQEIISLVSRKDSIS